LNRWPAGSHVRMTAAAMAAAAGALVSRSKGDFQ
jgi:hypothetical protein